MIKADPSTSDLLCLLAYRRQHRQRRDSAGGQDNASGNVSRAPSLSNNLNLSFVTFLPTSGRFSALFRPHMLFHCNDLVSHNRRASVCGPTQLETAHVDCFLLYATAAGVRGKQIIIKKKLNVLTEENLGHFCHYAI